ncbi:MAG: CotH kinase family protein [Syntrophothermus sp.]
MKFFFGNLFLVLSLFTINLTAQQKAVMVSPAIEFTSSNLPIVVINTNGRQIVDEPKIMADMGIIYNGEGKRNNLSDPFNHYKGKIAIEIRGTSSQQFPKKQYGFDTVDSLGSDLDVSLLGFPLESSWILSAQYNDKTLLRDVLSFDIAHKLGMYATRTKYCEVVLNGDYIGVYILYEKIKRDKNRVNISKMSTADTTGDALTGGYIVQIDRNEGSASGWQSGFAPYSGAGQRCFYQYVTPKGDEITPVQKTYLQKSIYNFEQKMYSPVYADTASGYPKMIDVNSFVNMFVLNEVTRNVDAYRLSAYMYKDRDSKDGRWKAGPPWDYGLAFANANYNNGADATGIEIEYFATSSSFHYGDQFMAPFWWYNLFRDKDFKLAAARKYAAYRKEFLEFNKMFSVIDSISTHIAEARERNFLRWPIMGKWVWPNVYVGSTYNDEIVYLQGWIIKRLNWLDDYFAPLVSVEENSVQPDKFTLSQNFPNPFNPVTTIKYSLPVSGQVKLRVFNSLGSEVASLVNRYQPEGTYSVEFDASGLASGIYYYRIETPSDASVKKMILLK